MAKNQSSEAQRAKEAFLAERARARAAMIEEAGFSVPIEPPPPSAPPLLSAEDRFAEQILARVNGGLPTTAGERLYLRRKLLAVPGGDEYVPSPIRAMPSEDKLLLEARLMIIDRAERKP
jgi:hypothetical protein